MTEELRRSEFTMHLREIRSRLGIVVATALAAFVFVGAWRLGQPTRYDASAVIQVSIGTQLDDDGDITEFRTRQLGELAGTAAVLDAVLADTGLDLDRGQLEDRIELELLDTPGFLTVSAQASTATEAASLANAVATQLTDLDQFEPLAPVEAATLVDPATAEDADSSDGTAGAVRDGLVAALAAAIVVGEGSVLLRIAQGRFSPTDPAIDAASALDAPVVDLRQPGRSEVVDFVVEHLRQHPRVVLLQLGSPESCKDTLTLTRIAGQLGDRVLLIDGDEGRSDLHGHIGLDAGPGLSDLAAGVVDLPGAIRPGGAQLGAAVLTSGHPSRSTHRAPAVLSRVEPLLDASGADLILVSVTSASSPEQQAGIVERLGAPVVLMFDPTDHRIRELRQEADRIRHLGGSVVGAALINSEIVR